MTAILEQDRREELLNYLEKVANDNQASDLFIVPYAPVYKKEGRELVSLGEMRTDEDTYALVEMIYKLSDRENHFQEFLRNGDDDFSFSVKGADRDRVPARFRVNTYRQRGSLAAVMRVVPYGIPDWQAMRIPPQVMELAGLTSDMVLITGPAGSGKSTTQACIINQISRNRSSHIITLEDPIEYRHDGGGDGPLAHCHPAHQGRCEHGGPHCRFLPQRPAGAGQGPAVHGAAYGGVSAAAAQRQWGYGARL